MQAVVLLIGFIAACGATGLLLTFSCWTFNRMFNLAQPGRGGAEHVDYTLYHEARPSAHRMPKVLSQVHARDSRGLGVPLPSPAKALLLAIGLSAAHAIGGGLLFLFMGVVGSSASLSPGGVLLLVMFFGLPASVFGSAFVLQFTLPCSFPRAISLSTLVWTMIGMLSTIALLFWLLSMRASGGEIDWFGLRDSLF